MGVAQSASLTLLPATESSNMPHEITVTWDASPGPISGYNLYRGGTADNESNVPVNGSTLITSTSFVDNTVFPGQTYFYEVTAVLNGIESVDSIEIRSIPVPFDPSPSPINLGTATSFGVLAGSTVTNVPGSATSIVGDVGVSPGTSITGFGSPASISGAFHSGDFVSAAAQAALTSAYNNAAAALNPNGFAATTLTGDIGGQTLLPGVYKSASSLAITGDLVLDAQGDTNAVWIFQIGSTLTTATNNSAVVLVGGAQPGNVFWQVGSSATLGISTSFAGTIMAQASITANTNAAVNGRLLARTGAVTLDDNRIALYLTVSLIDVWRPNTPFSVGQVLFDCATDTFQWVTTSGISGATRPAFASGPGATTQDGSVVWTDPPSPVFVLMMLPPSPPNTPPAPPSAPLNPRITSEA